MIHDVHAVHDGEKQIRLLIERRAASFAGPDPDELAPSWRESVQRFHEAAQAERRAAWCDYHRNLASMHIRLAAEHEEKADQLANPKPVVQTESVTGNGSARTGGRGVLSGRM